MNLHADIAVAELQPVFAEYVELNILLTIPVSIMHVNNETGNIQPVQEMGDYLLDKDVFSCRCNAKFWKAC